IRSGGKRSKTPWKIISVISGMVSEKAVAPIATAACFDAAVLVCWAASSRWMLTGMSRCAAVEALLLRALELLDRRLDADVGDLEDADQALGIGRAEAILQPAVVGADAGEVRVDIFVLHERQHRALGRVQHLGVDAVLVHDLEALGAVVARRVDVHAVALARPLELLGMRADAGDQTER